MDFLSASEAKLERVPDPGVLAKSAEEDRILVTHDFQTMRNTLRISCTLTVRVQAYSWCHNTYLLPG
jgi:hypothetical protein